MSCEKRYLLSGKLKCGYCGCNMVGSGGKSHTGIMYRYYICNKKNTIHCKELKIKREEIEGLVINTIIRLLNSPENKQYIVYRLLQMQNTVSDSNNLNYLQQKKLEVDKKINNLIALVEEGLLNEESKTRIKELQKEKQDIEGQINLLLNQQKEILNEDDINKYLNIVLKLKPQELINTFLKEARLYNTKIEIYINSPLHDNKEDKYTKGKPQGFEIPNNERFNLNEKKAISVKVKMV